MERPGQGQNAAGACADADGALVARVWHALEAVCDPEIPPLSIVDMGMVHEVRVEGGRARVRYMPTFAGCPALLIIAGQIEAAVRALGLADVQVEAVFDPAWHSDRITEDGLRKLREFGLAPPGRLCGGAVRDSHFERVACPYCGSRETRLESPFGPTLCRAMHYCDACRQSFEQFKPVELTVRSTKRG